mmetsp:Transcript_28349/g.86873  ORF Transcript_28349/g.86873 Transcript_28349/m.86873 type:complete len:210 (-) Transcript_28349:95-724(-)
MSIFCDIERIINNVIDPAEFESLIDGAPFPCVKLEHTIALKDCLLLRARDPGEVLDKQCSLFWHMLGSQSRVVQEPSKAFRTLSFEHLLCRRQQFPSRHIFTFALRVEADCEYKVVRHAFSAGHGSSSAFQDDARGPRAHRSTKTMRVGCEAFREPGWAANVQFELENQFASVDRQQGRPHSLSLFLVRFFWQTVWRYRDCLVLDTVRV